MEKFTQEILRQAKKMDLGLTSTTMDRDMKGHGRKIVRMELARHTSQMVRLKTLNLTWANLSASLIRARAPLIEKN